MENIRVLLITRECLRYDSNEGNVLLNLFSGMPVTLSNIYCKPGLPDNDRCGAYFQLTDRMALENLLHRTPMGRTVSAPGAQPGAGTVRAEEENKKFYDRFRQLNWEVLHLARECLWQLADLQSPALDAFLRDFAPDLIFAPVSHTRFVLRLQRYVIRKCGCPALTYIWDDLYSLRQLYLSPFFWLNRFLLRAAIRKTLPLYSRVYTMSPPQADAFGRLLGVPVQVLYKCTDDAQPPPRPHSGIRILYAGNIYVGRERTLARLAGAVRDLRAQGTDIRLDIFTAAPLRRRMRALLDDGVSSAVHAPVPATELRQQYAASDIALHAESLHTRYALRARLSFSTKIVDCLASGCAVLAVCPPVNAGWQYLKAEKAALCVGRAADIGPALRALAADAAQRQDLAAAAAACLQRNHGADAVRAQFLRELRALLAT